MTCYNNARFIKFTMDSILSQQYSNFEIIFVDDGSSDDSIQIARNYNDPRIVVFKQDNRGQSHAANVGYSLSSGDLIKFFDSDDVMGQHMLSLQAKSLGERNDAIAMGEWCRFFGSEPQNEHFAPLSMYINSKPVDWLVQEWGTVQHMMQCGLWLVPRQIIESRGRWDERLSLLNDFEYFGRLLTGASELLYTPDARIHYRSGLPGSLSGQRGREAIESAHLSLMLGTQHLLDAEDSPRTRKVCANVLQDFEYTYYPEHPDLRASMRARVRELGGSQLEPDGPPGFHKLRRFTGWKVARHVQRLAERRGWNNAARASNGRGIVT